MGGATTSSGGGGPSSMVSESRRAPEGPNGARWAGQADEDWCEWERGLAAALGARCQWVPLEEVVLEQRQVYGPSIPPF